MPSDDEGTGGEEGTYDQDMDDDEEGSYGERRSDLESNPDHAQDIMSDGMVDDRDDDDDEDDDMGELQFESRAASNRSPSTKNRDAMGRSNFLLSTASDISHSRGKNEESLPGSLRQSIEGSAGHSAFGAIARDMYAHLELPAVDEADDLILGTEALLSRIYEGDPSTEDVEDILATVSDELANLWARFAEIAEPELMNEHIVGIGPEPTVSEFANANFLAGLLLQLHHPPLRDSAGRSGWAERAKPVPQVLLDWLQTQHNPFPDILGDIQRKRPCPAEHPDFWNEIFNCLLRGRITEVASTLEEAGWRYAKTGSDGTTYQGTVLTSIETVVDYAVQILRQCPGLHKDWDTRGSDWTLFRLRVSQAMENLTMFAEGRDAISLSHNDDFGFPTATGLGNSMTATARKAASRVPWDIYMNLKTIYGLLGGGVSEIIACSQDWCEATIGLVVWWDQGKDDRRVALGRSQRFESAGAEESSTAFYLKKLKKSVARVSRDNSTTEISFQVNTQNPIEIGLACIFEGDIEGIVGLLRGWSGPLAAAVAEIATFGGWLPRAKPPSLITMSGLDQDDLDVLGIGQRPAAKDGVKDHTLIIYAQALAEKPALESTAALGHPSIVREGWEIAFEVLGRLDSAERSEEEVGQMLGDFPLDSSTTVDKLWRILSELGMSSHAEKTVEVSAPVQDFRNEY